MVTYDATTEGIHVSVRPVYLAGQSDLLARRFVFVYFVRIENGRLAIVKLLRRRWMIRESSGRVRVVEGAGVVGRQPVLSPGGVHEYSSYCVLPTFTGTMEGSYLMKREQGETFRVRIPRFNLNAQTN